MMVIPHSSDTTSASGAMFGPIRPPALVGVMLVGLGLGTSAAPVPQRPLRPPFQTHEYTTSGTDVVAVHDQSRSIAELRRRSGVTWDQLSRLFAVSRRSAHFWASGKAMTPANEEHLQRLLGVLRRIERGSPQATRSALFQIGVDGAVPFDLLAARQYERAMVAMSGSTEASGSTSIPPSAHALAWRAPQQPASLMDALQDRVHIERGAVRPAASVKAGRVRGGA